MLTFCLVGLLFGCFNIYKFLWKQGKYKVPVNVAIYIAAMLCLICNTIYTIMVPIKYFCNLTWFLTAYAAAYFDITVGIC